MLETPLPLGPYNFEIAKTVKFLGVILDTKLIWRQHIARLVKSCEQEINALRYVTQRSFGADPSICIMLYHHIVRSRLDYWMDFVRRCSLLLFRKIRPSAI